jgi:Rieske 2Fe-2S family protein
LVFQRVPAPIDAERLRPVLPSASGAGRTLPAEAYLSEQVLAWERAHLFDGSWTCLGRSEDVFAAGDQRAVRIGDEGILLVRGLDGILRGFFNTCRHRGHELLEAGGRRNLRAVKCPYHAWVYSLQGELAGAPRFGDVPGFRKDDFPLVPLAVAEWHGWVFANASGDAGPFEEHVGNLEELVAPWEPERLFVAETHAYVVEANWKVITENYHECYHCPSIHPALCAVTPVDSGANHAHDGAWVGGDMELMEHARTMSLTGESLGVPIRGLGEDQARRVYYFGLFPNLLISLHPDYVMTHRIEPLAPGRTRVECSWLFPPEAREVEGFTPAYASEFWDLTNREDWRACGSVQRGLASRGARQGPFAWSEDEVRAFMAMVADAYMTGRVTVPPQVETAGSAAS